MKQNMIPSEFKTAQLPLQFGHESSKQTKEFGDVDEYLEDLKERVKEEFKQASDQDKAIINEDYDIWFTNKGNRKETEVSNALYIKNIDKKIERKDIINLLMPFFNSDLAALESQVEVIVMKKGKMRGQGFLNFKETDKAVEIQEAINGIALGQKALVVN